jgi:eukaryotic-like serine/threonine-protein kinase
LRIGDVVAKRFRIMDRAGAGGMGVVFRAEDRETGVEVALKVLFPNQRPERFLREAAVLSEISHPAIVRYVAHGVTESGQVYLAMEWLEGQSLSRLIAERHLGYGECVTLLRRVCHGLAVAHDKGVVHRDLKPGNILLPEHSLAAAKIIDFGIARRRLDPRITERGLLVGTLAYMSPEQARGISDVAPSSDVFSLGSVVYKCLTGESPFGGGDATAILAKVLLDEPRPLAELVPGLPHSFDQLVGHMLAKTPEDRIHDASAVLEAVGQLEEPEPTPADGVPGITRREQRVVWVALVGGKAPADDETQVSQSVLVVQDPEAELAERVGTSGGRYDILVDGTRVASFTGGGVPRDEALRAVRTAERMRETFPGSPVAIASGLGVLGARAPVGEAIDRGVRLLSLARQDRIYLDDATAKLVSGSFELEPGAAGFSLLGAAREFDGTRRLLGRPTTCVGRDRELETLDALLDECIAEPVARASVVTAPAGVGKSRLRYEFLQRAELRIPELRTLFGRAEAVAAGSPFALLRQALRSSAGVLEGEPLEVSRTKIRDRVLRELAGSPRLGQTTVFLGELAGVPFPEDAHPTLRAARENPTLLGDAMRSAWLEFLEAECRAHPVVIVLEDLHWGDIPSASFVDAALAALGDAPLFVLALGRPELYDVFPGLWARRLPQEIRLGPIRRVHAIALAREVLGESAPAATVERIVSLADGNAFFLEELIRAVAEGKQQLPETVMAMMQARLEALGAEARRLLRAGSVFGAQFWLGGVRALLGSDVDPAFVAQELDDLSARELVSRRPVARFGAETEYVFRHATLQETVYATLTPEDKRLGHRLAAEWLEQVGALDAVALAEHFQRGALPERAARWYLAAAEQALEGIDLEAVVERVDLALRCNPDPLTRGALHYLAAEAHFWRGEYVASEDHARAALKLLPESSARWFVSIGALCSAAGTLGKNDELIDWAKTALAAVPTSEEARAAQVVCVVRASHGHFKLGLTADAEALVEHAAKITSGLSKLRPLGEAWVHHGKSALCYYRGDVAEFLREIELSIAGFDAVGDGRTGCNSRANLGYATLSIGDFERASKILSEALELTERLGMAGIGHYVLHNLGLVKSYLGETEQAIELERRAIEEAETRNETLLIGASHLYMSIILLRAGDAVGALHEARQIVRAASDVPILLAQAAAAESAALLASGEREQALERAEAGAALLSAHPGTEEAEGRVRAAHIEALRALGRDEEAKEASRTAMARLRERAARLGDPRIERCFLENVPEHARIAELAREYGVS